MCRLVTLIQRLLSVSLVFGLSIFPLRAQQTENTRSIGTPYVELASWIYPAIERLAALGYIHAEFLGMRPWTRIECAGLIQNAGNEINSGGSALEEASQLQIELQKEFQPELDALSGGSDRTVRVESVYANLVEISGRPLNDSYHFGQTLINNNGRPYKEGFNSWDGFSGYATRGRFAIYVRGEYQRAPSASEYALPVRQVIAEEQPPVPSDECLDYKSVPASRHICRRYYNLANWNLAFGKQSLWWGPGEGSAFLFSDNAEPIYCICSAQAGSRLSDQTAYKYQSAHARFVLTQIRARGDAAFLKQVQ